jgi:hypothetical protein
LAEAHLGELPPGTKHCRVCYEPINKHATKCIHCQSEQGGIRSRLGLSGTILSLLVALVSVSTVAAPVLINAFTPKNSNLVFSFQGANSVWLSLVVMNQGTRPGSVRAGLLRFPDYDPADEKVVQLSLVGSGPVATIVPPNTTLALSFIKDQSERMSRVEFQKIKSCELVIWATDFTGKGTPKYMPIECVELTAFVSALHQ